MDDRDIIAWKIFYGDGSTFSSKDGEWEDAPTTNIQVVMLYERWTDEQGRNKRRIMAGYDFYFKDGDTYGSYNLGDQVRLDAKTGEWISNKDFADVEKRAIDDYDA